MNETFRHLDALREKERRVVMATLVATRGTTPKKEGSKMWVGEDGGIRGSVTIGGCVDARVMEESDDVLAENRPRRVSMSLSDEEAWDLGMTCGGLVEVLLEPVDLALTDDPVITAYEAIRREVDDGRRAVAVVPMAPVADERSRMVVGEEGGTSGSLGDAALDAAAREAARRVLEEGRSRIEAVDPETAGEAVECFFELHAPPTTLVIFGAGNVAIPLARIAREVGWRVEVVDNRERLATPERFPDVHALRVGMVDRLARSYDYDRSIAVGVVAHDYKYEVPVLKTVLAGDPAYVGVLGSRKRGAALLDFLADAGVPREELDRVRVPVGLDVGAGTAAEIAVSIVAEILAVQSGRPGTPMRERRSR